jgi:ferric-dicitrate binding protein FerR (iron transport regulator)
MSQPSSRVAELIEKHLTGEMSPAEAAELRQALTAQPALAQHLYSAARMHRLLQTRLGTAGRSGGVRGGESEPKRFRRNLRLFLPLAAAAALAIGMFNGYFATGELIGQAQSPGLFVTRAYRERPLTSGDPLFTGDRLRASVRADLRLADGSSVRLDAGTALVMAKPGAEERMHLALAAGRVFLRVAKAPGRFCIVSGTASIDVLGTVFGVARADGGAVASVYEGRVRLGTDAGQIELGRGEAARAAAGAAPVRTSDAPSEALAWARDWTRFEDRPLGEVLDWIASNSPYRFDAPAEVRAQRVSIAIADEPVSCVLTTLLISCNLHRSNNNNDVSIQQGTP